MENKVCKNCCIEKNINEFKNTGKLCRICFNEYMRLRRPKKVKVEKVVIPKIHKPKKDIKLYQKEYRENNKYKQKEYNKKYQLENKEYISNYRKEYMKENLSYYQTYKKEYRKNRLINDSLYKFSHNVQSLIRQSLKNKGYKKHSRTEHILGCSYIEFKEYIINQFEPWMTLENNGIYTGNYDETWQFDHIIAISNALNEDEVIKLNHYTNFRPLCSRKNLEKSNS